MGTKAARKIPPVKSAAVGIIKLRSCVRGERTVSFFSCFCFHLCTVSIISVCLSHGGVTRVLNGVAASVTNRRGPQSSSVYEDDFLGINKVESIKPPEFDVSDEVRWKTFLMTRCYNLFIFVIYSRDRLCYFVIFSRDIVEMVLAVFRKRKGSASQNHECAVRAFRSTHAEA